MTDYGQRMSGVGSSESSIDARKKAIKIFDEFCIMRNLAFTMTNITAQDFCSQSLMEAFSDFLVNDYKVKEKKKGSEEEQKNMMLNGVKNTLSQIMTAAKLKFTDDKSYLVTDFFAILGLSQTAPNNWYRDLRKEIERQLCRRAIDKGEAISTKATPISWTAVKDASYQYFMTGTPDAMLRRSVIVDSMLSSGRGNEAVTSSYELMLWDWTYGCLIQEYSQRKTGKQKPIMHINFNPGPLAWNADFFHVRGCLYMAGKGQGCLGEGVEWVYPEIASIGNSSKAQKLTLFLTDTKKHPAQSVSYRHLNVKSMPVEPSSGGIRSGAIHEMTRQGVSQKGNEAVSGHDHRGESASYEYQYTTREDLIGGKSS